MPLTGAIVSAENLSIPADYPPWLGSQTSAPRSAFVLLWPVGGKRTNAAAVPVERAGADGDHLRPPPRRRQRRGRAARCRDPPCPLRGDRRRRPARAARGRGRAAQPARRALARAQSAVL